LKDSRRKTSTQASRQEKRLNAAVKEMNTPFYSADDFIHSQVEGVLTQYTKWLEEKEEHEKTKRKRM